MNRSTAIVMSTAVLAVVALSAGPAAASGGSGGGASTSGTGSWPAAYPLPTDPGTVVSQGAAAAVVRSTDRVVVVKSKLDDLYVARLGCTEKLTVNKPKDYLCVDAVSGRTAEVSFTFAALDPTAGDPAVSQTNAFLSGR